MAFAFLFAGVLLTVSAVRGTHSQLAALIKGDFSGPGNFLLWAVGIVILGAVGYIPALRKISAALVGVVLLGLFLAKANPKLPGGGFFAQLQSALSKTTGAAAPSVSDPATGSTQQSTPGILNGLPSLPELPTMTDLWQMLGIAN